jgi:hypothetical protein
MTTTDLDKLKVVDTTIDGWTHGDQAREKLAK